MNTYHLLVSTPDGNKVDSDVYELSLRATEGDVAVLAGHIPFVTAVVPGECRIEFADETEKTAVIDGGLLTVTNEKTILSVGSFEWK